MKRSKKNFVRLLLKFAKRYFPQKLYSLILFLRSFRALIAAFSVLYSI